MVKLIEHLPLTIFVVVIFFFIEGLNLDFIFLCLLFGWLIDIDHVIDFLLLNNKGFLNVKVFLSGSYFQKSQKIFIIFHSYEITFLLFVFSVLIDQNTFYVALAHFFHLLQDQIFNKVRIFSYFFIYRLINKFNINAVCI